MSDQPTPSVEPLPEEEQALELARQADELTKDVEPDEYGEIGDYEGHLGRGVEEDPGEDEEV
jgi:hypothetical protein